MVKRLLAVVLILGLVAPVPAFAQKSEARLNKEHLATFVFWTGIGVAASGAAALPMSKQVGSMFMLPGAGLIVWGVILNNQAKNMASTTFQIIPQKKGIAFGISRTWK